MHLKVTAGLNKFYGGNCVSNIALSICIPTNGIVEWVVPVLKSIYSQDVSIEEFEVVLCDNSKNNLFIDNEEIRMFFKKSNLHYFKSDSEGFLNQIFSFKKCKGDLIKFVNHRRPMMDGSIKFLIDFSKRNKNKKNILFFTNNGKGAEIIDCKNYDDFLFRLGILSSWSGGVGFWKDNFDFNAIEIDKYFPHFCLLQYNKNSNYTIINKKIFCDEVESSAAKKGSYNLFYVFGVHFLNFFINLFYENKINFCTFQHIYREVFKFISNLYLDFVVLKKPCSYILDNYKIWINIFYSLSAVRIRAFYILIGRLFKKII